MQSDATIELDFAGSPGILVPASVLDQWHGMYVATEDSDSADLTFEGSYWLLDDEMDFDDPRTAYDRICAVEGQMLSVTPLADEQPALVLYGDGDRWRYLPEHQAILSNPDPASIQLINEIARNGWRDFSVEEACDWIVSEPLSFFNSGAHGGMLSTSATEHSQLIDLSAGAYQPQYGMVGASQVFRFVRT